MIMLVAHRGFSSVAPENTLVAFEEALSLRPDAVELDVRASKDGRLVIMHDAKVDRTTNGTGAIAEMTLAELKKLDAGSKKDARYAGERIPTLRESLELVKDRAWLFVEIKVEGIEKAVLDEIRAAGMLGQVVVISFYDKPLSIFKEMEPLLPTGLLVGESAKDATPEQLLERVMRVRADSLSIAHTALTKDLIVEGKHRGIPIWTWTMDEPADIERAIDFDVDAITSNCPDRAQEILRRRGEEVPK